MFELKNNLLNTNFFTFVKLIKHLVNCVKVLGNICHQITKRISQLFSEIKIINCMNNYLND